jgi:hypothetical protein
MHQKQDYSSMSDTEKENSYDKAAQDTFELLRDCLDYAGHELGLSRFQAGWASLHFLFESRGMKLGGRIIDYNDLLYPQYENKLNGLNWKQLICDNRDNLVVEANKLIKSASNSVHPSVLQHWKDVADRRDCDICPKRFKCLTGNKEIE